MGLGKQERRGVVILVLITLVITALGFFMRYCNRPDKEASQVPVQTVIYRAADDAGDEESGSRHKKKSRRKKSGTKKTKQSKGRKGTGSKAGTSDSPRRDFLRDSIPGPRED